MKTCQSTFNYLGGNGIAFICGWNKGPLTIIAFLSSKKTINAILSIMHVYLRETDSTNFHEQKQYLTSVNKEGWEDMYFLSVVLF